VIDINNLEVIKQWAEEISELFLIEVEKFSTWPADRNEWTSSDSRAYWETYKRIAEETDVGASFIRATDALEAAFKQIEGPWQ
jgi:hypothetical protein